MGARTSNIVFMVVGLVLVFIYVHARLHHHYEFYYDYYGGGFVSNIFYLLLGVFFFLGGLIGLVRGKRSV
jgi:hypothetical protein